ncbi:MAG TPA: glycosyl hydrolase family 59 [Clostridiales bacterium]|nr:glycosyl hydrolase family 59 [Clostridiales bacterium]
MKQKLFKGIIGCILVVTMLSSCSKKDSLPDTPIEENNIITTPIKQEDNTPETVFTQAEVNPNYMAVSVDGATTNTNPAATYRGLGMVTGNNSSRLLIDYKQDNPEQYWEILNYLFKKDHGAGLTHIKMEFGTDVNSSSGTEPSTMRSQDEHANVRRGAGFMLVADALSINPEITVDLLRWGEPKWVTDAFDISTENGHEARYKWYLNTINAAYDEFGIKFSYISADANEPNKIDAEWIIYLSEHLKNETNSRYDYSEIKIVASDEVGSWKIADEMISNEQLRNAVDVLGVHYNTYASDNAIKLHEEYGKEIWYSEGIASCNMARLAVNSNGSGINGENGCLDVCNRIINSYYNGRMTMYEYQPAVAAYYTGAKFFPKSLINANEPWSGYYELDAGVWTSAHFTMFMEKGWQYIDSACFGDGKENHSISETTNNYMTVTNPETGDYSIVVSNDSDEYRNYTFTVSNLSKAGEPFYIWETIGPKENQEYNENYLRNIGAYTPASNGDGTYSYSVEVKPYSIITITTLNKENVLVPKNEGCKVESQVIPLPYSDDFEYGENFVTERGGTPKYTTDQGGAFEVVESNGGFVLMQMINADNKPTDWRLRSTPMPITSLGDDRWSNYSASVDVMLESINSDNYAGIGVRYINSETNSDGESGYAIRLYGDGKWELRKNRSNVSEGTIDNFDPRDVHNIKVLAVNNIITAYVDGNEVASYTEENEFINSGRISLSSGLYNNVFDNLKAEPATGKSYAVTRIDDHENVLNYSGDWEREVPKSYTEFNRTTSTAHIKEDSGDFTLSFNFTGTELALIGFSGTDFDITIDGASEKVEGANGRTRQCFYKKTGLSDGLHTVEIRVIAGKFVLDAIEIS